MSAQRDMAAKSNDTAKPATAELAITRVLDAPRALVFEAWTEPERIVQWFGPGGFTVASCEMNVRPGGAFRIRMRSPQGTDHSVQGVYRDVVAPERLVFSWAWENAEGKLGHETLVTLTFAEQGERTKLTLHHALFESDTARDQHQSGWTSSLECLAEYLATA
jgi:uncharacterized protein YndB with AHSA1/START domain